jgi:hypothetical protein
MWHADAIREAWPNMFKLNCYKSVKFLPDDRFLIIPGKHIGSVADNTIALYMLWFVPYVSYMIVIGLDMPRKNRPLSPNTKLFSMLPRERV